MLATQWEVQAHPGMTPYDDANQPYRREEANRLISPNVAPSYWINTVTDDREQPKTVQYSVLVLVLLADWIAIHFSIYGIRKSLGSKVESDVFTDHPPTSPSLASQPYLSLFPVPTGNKDKYGWLARLPPTHPRTHKQRSYLSPLCTTQHLTLHGVVRQLLWGSQYSCWENDRIPNFAADTSACMPLLPNMHINLAFLCYPSATALLSYAHIHALVHATMPTIGACFPSNSNDRKHPSMQNI